MTPRRSVRAARLAALLLVGAAAAPAAVATAPPAAAAAPCVGVVVDASRAGGPVQSRCARLDPSTGLAALKAAGFTPRLRPDGLVCQLGRTGRRTYPDRCVASVQRYWSYWYRQPGSSRWVYSNRGPGARNPRPGSTEAWVFQVGGGRARPPAVRQATICPPVGARRAAAPAPSRAAAARAPAPSRAAAARAPARSRAPSSPAAGSRAPASTPAATSTTSAESTGGTAAAEPSTEAGAGAPGVPVGDGADRAAGREGTRAGGTPWAGLLGGGLLVGAIAAAAVLRARKP
jgi:hypothetical protein